MKHTPCINNTMTQVCCHFFELKQRDHTLSRTYLQQIGFLSCLGFFNVSIFLAAVSFFLSCSICVSSCCVECFFVLLYWFMLSMENTHIIQVLSYSSLVHQSCLTCVLIQFTFSDIGFNVPDKFIVGYCLDYNEQFRDILEII